MSDFVRIAAAVPALEVGNPVFNVKNIIDLYRRAAKENSALVLFPELALTGYSCGDLFEQDQLHTLTCNALRELVQATQNSSTIAVAGLPVRCGSRLFSGFAVCQNGELLGIAAKTALSNHRGFQEKRLFSSGWDAPGSVSFDGKEIPFVPDLLMDAGSFRFAVLSGSMLDSTDTLDFDLASAGAEVLLYPGAEMLLISSLEHRAKSLAAVSARLNAACVFCGAGTGESGSEQLFSGQSLIAENGRISAANTPADADGNLIFADIDPKWINARRRSWSSFNDAESYEAYQISCTPAPVLEVPQYIQLDTMPFVPSDPAELAARCDLVLDIQAKALAGRMKRCGAKRMVLGISGGLDSTLALLAAARCCKYMGKSADTVLAVTMPGFGTTERTRGNADTVTRELGAELRTIAINDAVKQHFKDIGHDPAVQNVVYENSQARERTQILMDIANAENAIVVGTGDLSEIALGWSTFNGDQMSMYGINCGVPKTLLRHVVQFAARSTDNAALRDALLDVCSTPVSPELIPGVQHTEALIGNYELHDFFLYYFIKYGESAENLLLLAKCAFKDTCSEEKIKQVLQIFIRRFFTQQFKRNASPDGPAVGTVSLSSRSTMRFPSDASFAEYLLS